MNVYKFGDLKRISKVRARRLWGKGKRTIILCPVKLRPGGPWHPEFTATIGDQLLRKFDETVDAFESCNCNSNETGYYTAFYLRGE